MSESGEFEAALTKQFQFLLDDIHTFFPATIISVRPTGLVDIQPNVKVRFKGETINTQLPNINNVVLLEARSEGAIIRFPKEDIVGTKVGVFIAEHSLTEWREQKGVSAFPEEDRRFDINDAVAVLGLYPETAPWLVPQKPNTLDIMVKEGNKISIGNQKAELLKILHDALQALEGDFPALVDLRTLLLTITNL